MALTINDRLSLREKYEPAMRILDQEAADEYFDKLVRHTMKSAKRTRAEAELVERSNLGYWAGYHSNEVRRRVERLFKCEHPFFGPIAANGAPTARAAFEAGLRAGKASRRD